MPADDDGKTLKEGRRETVLLNELEKGPWPSFVTEIKAASATSERIYWGNWNFRMKKR